SLTNSLALPSTSSSWKDGIGTKQVGNYGGFGRMAGNESRLSLATGSYIGEGFDDARLIPEQEAQSLRWTRQTLLTGPGGRDHQESSPRVTPFVQASSISDAVSTPAGLREPAPASVRWLLLLCRSSFNSASISPPKQL